MFFQKNHVNYKKGEKMSVYGKKFMKKLVALEPNIHRLTWSIVMGVFLAFSPYLGLQSPLAFLGAFLFGLNSAVALILIWTINNPWVMVPLAGLEYIFGRWLIETVFGVNLVPYNPSWMTWLNNKINFITEYLGIESICLWYFLIGGTMIAFLAALITYPIARKMSSAMIKKYSPS